MLDYPERLRKLLLTPQRELHVELNITLDNGEIEMFDAYRVQHDNSRGPYKGGFRFHQNVSMDDVRRHVSDEIPSKLHYQDSLQVADQTLA